MYDAQFNNSRVKTPWPSTSTRPLDTWRVYVYPPVGGGLINKLLASNIIIYLCYATISPYHIAGVYTYKYKWNTGEELRNNIVT